MKRGNHWSTLCRTAPVQAYASAVIHKTGLVDTLARTSIKLIFSAVTWGDSVIPSSLEKPASSGVCFTVSAMPKATIPQIIAGTQNSQRQCKGGTCHNPRKVNQASNAGPILKIPKRPRLIMNPKMPAKRPRSRRANHAVLILIMPGAPKDCM